MKIQTGPEGHLLALKMASASLNICCTHPSNTLPSNHCTGSGSALCLSILIIASLPKLPGPSCWVAAQPWTHLTWEAPYALSILPISLALSLSLSVPPTPPALPLGPGSCTGLCLSQSNQFIPLGCCEMLITSNTYEVSDNDTYLGKYIHVLKRSPVL